MPGQLRSTDQSPQKTLPLKEPPDPPREKHCHHRKHGRGKGHREDQFEHVRIEAAHCNPQSPKGASPHGNPAAASTGGDNAHNGLPRTFSLSDRRGWCKKTVGGGSPMGYSRVGAGNWGRKAEVSRQKAEVSVWRIARARPLLPTDFCLLPLFITSPHNPPQPPYPKSDEGPFRRPYGPDAGGRRRGRRRL